MNGVTRAALAAWIVFLMAVLAVWLETRTVRLRYELAARRRQVHAETLEHRRLLAEVEAASRPEALRRRAEALGILGDDRGPLRSEPSARLP